MNDTYSVKPPVSNFDNDDSEDFATLFEATQISNGRSGQEESKVVADIVSIGDEWIFLDIGGKTEGIISKEEFLDDNGVLTVKKGDPITAYIIRKRDGEILLSTKMTLAASSEAAREAFQRGIPVEGLVCEERKGGFSVKVFGKSAFCPYSQIDLSSAKPAPEYLGKKFSFKVTEYSDRGKNIVLSRRRILEEERLEKIEELKKRLKLEDIVIGSVKRLESFGAFVDIGGIEGLVPISEISWGRVEDISCFLSIDQNIPVKLINLDWDRNRISLSVKRAMEDPWSLVESSYKVGAIVTGKVTRLTNFGAFLELEPGVEGLIHISNLGQGRRINHPREVISTGLTLNVRVISVDASARRIGLELERETQENDEKADVELKPGLIVTGTVDSIQEYGLFIKLPGGKTGLLHVSEMVSAKSVDAKKKYPPGSSIDIQILTVDEQSDRISLSLKSLGSLSEKKQVEDFRARGASPQSFGTLGDLFKEKLLKK